VKRLCTRARIGCALIPVLLFCAACEREKRELQPPPDAGRLSQSVPTTGLHAGGGVQTFSTPLPDEKNAYAISQGQQHYDDFNCGTCHAQGGGDIGPPLADDKWIYGSDPRQIFASIVEGRPNGMPSFGQKIVDGQVWQLVAYIRSMGGLAPKGVAPGRSDHLKMGLPPNSTDPQKPVGSAPQG
jgi:cytochrome c oxidase cbb3-type subunit 3